MVTKKVTSLLIIILSILIIGYLVFFPLVQQYLDLSKLYDHKRLINSSLITLTALTFLFSRNLQQHWILTWNTFSIFVRTSFTVILGIGLISTILSPLPIWALLEITHYCLLFVLMVGISMLVQQYPSLMKQILLLACTAFAFIFLFQTGYSFIKTFIITYPHVPRSDTFIGAFSFSYIRIFNQIQTFTLPLLGVAVIYCTKINKAAVITTFLLLCGWWLLVFISGARGTILAATAGITIGGFLIYRFNSNWLKVQLFAFLIGAAGYYLFFYSAGETARSITREGSSGRLNWWLPTAMETFEKPIFGYGPMHSSIEGLGLHGHNYFLTMSYEWGIPAALLFTAVLGFSLFKFYKRINNEQQVEEDKFDKVFKTGLLASLVAFWIQSLLEGLLSPPLTQIWLAFLLGTAIGLYYKGIWQSPKINPSYNWKFSTFILSTLVIFIWSVYPSITNFEERQREYVERYDARVLWPRFWQQGKIGWEDEQKNQEIIKKYDIR